MPRMAIPVAIIDDDASVCRSLSRLLRLAGFEPRAFHSAEAFLGDCNRGGFRCLLVDVQLNGMSGIDMQRAWNAQPGHAPLIFITAYDARKSATHIKFGPRFGVRCLTTTRDSSATAKRGVP